MNEDQVTTLLDRLGRNIEVSIAPIVAATEDGRRRLRWRHRAQVGGAAAVVLAIAGGGLVLQQQRVAGGQANRPPTVAPSVDALVGRWVPVMLAGNPNPREGAAGRSIFFTQGSVAGRFVWVGQEDCDRVRGTAQVGPDGSYHARMTFTTGRYCLLMPSNAAYSGVDAVTEARHVKTTANKLIMTEASGRTLAIFVRYHPTPPRTRPRLVGRIPSRDELLGTWRPIEIAHRDVSAERRRNGLPIVVIFHAEKALPAIPNASFYWQGNDGCNWTTGLVTYVETSGFFGTTGNSTTDKGCIGFVRIGPTEVDMILAVREVRLVDQDLELFNEHRQLIGILTRAQTS